MHINDEIRRIIRRTDIDPGYAYDQDALLDGKIRYLVDHCEEVLDFGRSSRERFGWFAPAQVTTCDINQYEGYPDVVDDICDLEHLQPETFDGIVCLAVLEHVYDPFRAAANLHSLLRDGGYALVYTPLFWRYHAPEDLKYQDFFRYTRDGLAWLFRDFSEVTLFPVRGRYSTILNLHPAWKYKVERRWGQTVNKVVDRLLGGTGERLQVSGYYTWARK